MGNNRLSDSEIIEILREAEETSQPVTVICKKYGISRIMYERWREKYGDDLQPDALSIQELKKEIHQLRLEKISLLKKLEILQEVLEGKH